MRPTLVLVLLAFSGLLPGSALADEIVRIMAANTSSGNNQSYPVGGPGDRIFQGLDPDIALVQEMNVGSNSSSDYRSWVNLNFGTSFQYFVESGAQIPNGIVSRYPILSSGNWADPEVSNRGFSWARIDIPGDKHLLAVSVHLLTRSASARNAEATALVNLIKTQSQVPAGDFLVIGGDLNTDNRNESCLTTFSQLVRTTGPYPADHSGNGNTNASRAKPYDWVLPGNSLATYSTPLVVGGSTYTNGIVFDSRVFTPISSVPPVLATDSGATNMQHMAVMRAFLIPTNEAPVIAQGPSASVTLSRNNTPVAFSLSLSATDADSDPLSWSIATPAAHGTAGIVAPATGGGVALSYQPVTNYTGSDSFVVRVSDGQGGTDSITVNLTIQPPPNNPPVIAGPAEVPVTLSQNNHPQAFSLQLSATDADANPLQWSISSPASHGSAAVIAPVNGGNASFSYQPASGYTGADAFTVRVSDGQGGTDEVTITLNVIPASAYDRWTFGQFAPLDPAGALTVWGEGNDPDGDGYTNLSEFAHGLDPQAADAAPNLMSCALVEGRIELSYKIRMDGGLAALDYEVLSAQSLDGPWTILPLAAYTVTGEVAAGPGFVLRTIRLSGEVETSPRFFRLRMSR